MTFEWGEGSVFAPPLNAWHRLSNGSREPAVFMAVTTAPRVMADFPYPDFVFNCDHQFLERFGSQTDYFTPGESTVPFVRGRNIWETNFIPDATTTTSFMESQHYKVEGAQSTIYRMAGNFPSGHISEWPVGRYHAAHYHGPGAMLLGLKGSGYVLLWHRDLGDHPYSDGHEDQVVKIDWGPRSIYSPSGDWYHQHFNTSNEPARHIAIYQTHQPLVITSSRDGGTILDHVDEDPQILRRFEEALKEKGVECTMTPVAHRS